MSVFGRFLFQNVHRVVVSDNPDQPVLIVHHRNRDEVVSLQLRNHVFLVVVDADGDDVPRHDLRQHGVRPGEDQIPE